MKSADRKRNIVLFIMVLTLCFIITGCAGSSEGADESSVKKGSYKIPEFRDSVFDAGKAKGNSEVKIDLSHTSKGYISLKADSSSRLKLQIVKSSEKYLYDIEQDKKQVFPLQCGNGSYNVKVMKNVSGDQYYELYKCRASVKLKDEFEPYIRPNQYADYSKSSECVKKAAEMAKSSSSEEDFVEKVYDYIRENIKYDKEKAKGIQTGYIPDPDSTMASGKGICFDYACLTASMLRSQGIPTRIIFGYVQPDDLYHAWNMFYTKEKGWTSVEFSVNPDDWNRIDMTFYANGEDDEFIGDGSNYTDVYKF